MAIQYFLLIVCIAAVAFVWRRARQGALGRFSAMLWTVLWTVGGLVVLRPEVASFFATVLGVGRGADLVVYLSIVFGYYLMFRMYLRIEKLEQGITGIVRKISLKEGIAEHEHGEK